MKKIFIIILVLLLTACSSSNNTPTSAVETYLSKYQNLDSDVLKELDKSISKEDNMSSEQKNKYKDLWN